MTNESIIEKIERSRVELLDLTLRNPLLNYKMLKSKGVETSGAKSAEVFRALVIDRKPLRFLATDARSAADALVSTTETGELLQERLLQTYIDANTLLEEQGVNTLFIALGMVNWRESDFSQVERRAPLILIPVRLDRADVNSAFRVSYTGEELGGNIVFRQKALNDFDLEIPDLVGDEEADAEDVDVDVYFAEVARAIGGLKRWSVEQDSVALGFFSFNKLLVYRDLAAETWRDYGNPPNMSHFLKSGCKSIISLT